MENELYIYKEEDLFQEDLYLNKWQVGFVKELGYVGGITSRDEASQRCLKRLIETYLLMDA